MMLPLFRAFDTRRHTPLLIFLSMLMFDAYCFHAMPLMAGLFSLSLRLFFHVITPPA